MKKITYPLSTIAIFIVVIFACNTKDIVLVTNVDYVTTIDATEEGFVKDLLVTSITVTPEVALPEFVYSYKYEIIEGTGVFEDQNKNALPENENIALDPETAFSVSLNYKGLNAGKHQVKITTSDNFEKTQEFTLFYTIKNLNLVWTATTTVTKVKPGNKVPITITLENTTPDRPVTFQRNYRFTQGSGILSDAQGDAVVLENLVAIVPGTYLIEAVANQTGTTAITFDLIDSNGQEKSQTVTFDVTEDVLSNAAEIIAISISDNTGIITGDTIEISLPPGTDRTNLVPSIVISDKATISPVSGSAQNFTNPVVYTVTAEDQSTKTYTVSIKNDEILSSESEIIAISIDATNGLISGNAITISLPEGTNLSALRPTVIVSDKATVIPASNTIQDFNAPKTYIVTAEDGSTTNYIVEVVLISNPLSNENDVISFDLPNQVGNSVIDPTDHTVAVTVPLGTNISNITPNITISPSATYSPTGVQNFNTPVVYTVTAENETTQNWTVTVTIENDPRSSDNDITGFTILGQVGNSTIDPTNHTVALTVPFGTDIANITPNVTVSPSATFSPTGVQNFNTPVVYTVTAENETTQNWTVTVTIENDPRSSDNDITGFTILGQVGNSAIDPTNHTVALTVPFGTDITNLTPTITVSLNASYDPTGAQNFESPVGYLVLAENGGTQTWTVTVTIQPDIRSGANDITAFALPGQISPSVINTTNHTVTATVPFGTTISGVTPIVLSVSPDATYTPQGSQNFNTPVVYTVTAEDETTQNWTVTVTVENDPRSSDNDITGFIISGQVGNSTIDPITHNVAVIVPFGTDITSITPSVTVSTNASYSPTGTQNFATPRTYVVTAENEITQDWIITITVAPDTRSDAKEITAFTVPGQVGTTAINTTSHTVRITVPYGTNLANISPTIGVSPNATYTPINATNFTSAVTYTVTAENQTSQEWTIIVNTLKATSLNQSTGIFTAPANEQIEVTYNGGGGNFALNFTVLTDPTPRTIVKMENVPTSSNPRGTFVFDMPPINGKVLFTVKVSSGNFTGGITITLKHAESGDSETISGTSTILPFPRP